MKSIFRFLAVALAGLLLFQGQALAQALLRGKVTDTDGKPLAGV